MAGELELKKIILRDCIYKTLIAQYKFATLQATQMIYVYEDGIYVGHGRAESIIKSATEKAMGNIYKTNDGNEIVNRIKITSTVPDTFFDGMDKRYICVEDGILNLDVAKQNIDWIVSKFDHSTAINNAGYKNPLEPFDPAKPFLNKIKVKWDSKSNGCPQIELFLASLFDAHEDIEAIYEFIGYCLYRGYPIQQAFMFVGEGSNGKSTLLDLINRFLGSINVSHISLQDICSKFAVVNLHGKLANFYADLSDDELTNTGVFKMLTGGNDTFGAEIKFIQDRLEFINYAKFAFSCNKIPENKNDDSYAFWRRWIIFNFVKVFSDDNNNIRPQHLDKLCMEAEFEGLLQKAITGLCRLLKNGKFSNYKDADLFILCGQQTTRLKYFVT